MRYNTITAFPNRVDELVYFSDPSYYNKDTMDEYNRLFREGKIDEAVEVVSADQSMHYGSAHLINKFEYQIKKIQEYLKYEFVTDSNPMIHGSEPEDPETHYIWIAEE